MEAAAACTSWLLPLPNCSLTTPQGEQSTLHAPNRTTVQLPDRPTVVQPGGPGDALDVLPWLNHRIAP
jgi:hypothetical protein